MSKLVALLALACLVLTALWVGLLIADMATAGPLETFEQVVVHASRLHGLFYATYLNAALLTLAVVAFFATLHAWLRPTAPVWALIGLVFVPIYGAFNLVAYLWQVTLIPALVTLRLDPQTTAMADVLLRLTLQAWPGSTIAFFNSLAYAMLGIPSILYGALLWRRGSALGWGGLLLALSGADSLEAAQITLAALKQAGVRAVIQGWDKAMKQLSIPSTVFHTGSVPHDWLLTRASGFVHHGGFGTTASAFRAGIPMLVVPHIIDQFIWGGKVAQLGVGPQPIPRPKLKVEPMAAALRQMQSPDMRQKATALGAAIRAEPDGVAEAVRLIEDVFRLEKK